MDTITGTEQATETLTTGGLAVELVDALYPQWFVNGHNLPAAFQTVAERHVDPVVRLTADTTPLLPALLTVLEARFWQRARSERAMQRA